MQPTPSEPQAETTIIRTGSDGRLRYTPAQRQQLLEAFERSGLSAMAFSKQHGVSYQTFIAWLRKRRLTGVTGVSDWILIFYYVRLSALSNQQPPHS